MKVVLASQNTHKIAELRALLSKHIPDIEVLSLSEAGFSGEIIEDGETFEENAYIKARAAASTGYIGLGDDSGLSVRALGGAPGIYSARYAGEHGNDEANNTLLLENLRTAEDRHAEFVCVIACAYPDKEDAVFCRGATEGVIIDEYKGNGGFGYDPLFYYEPFGKTFAEVPAEDKHSVSHRGEAMKKFAEKLKSLL